MGDDDSREYWVLGKEQGRMGSVVWTNGNWEVYRRPKRNWGFIWDVRRKFGHVLGKNQGILEFIREGQREVLGFSGKGPWKCWGSQ